MTDYTIVMKEVNTIEEAFEKMAAGIELYRANFLIFDMRYGKHGNFVKVKQEVNGGIEMESICNYSVNKVRKMFQTDCCIYYFEKEEVKNETENEE